MLLSGEPGIGKTRLAEELAHRAVEQGATVRWGRCREGAGAPAFWPWIQILRTEIKETDPEELRAHLGSGTEEIVRLVPELCERMPGVPVAPLADDAGARFRLFDSVVGFLRASAACQPLVLILEDLHWAQPASVELLRFLTEEMQEARILVIATYRDIDVSEGHPLAAVLRAPSYPPQVQRIGLAGLSEEEIGQLIEALGHEGSVTLAARIHRESGGNPFFAAEIVRGLNTAEPGIPGSVRDAIAHRLQGLSEPCRRLLRIASVLSAEFGLGALERVAAEVGDCAPVLPSLSEAEGARIVVEMPGGARGYRFAHALIREVLYTGLPLEVRLGLHWQVATALEALGGPDRERAASVLAHHFSEAIAGCADGAPRQACIDKAVQYAIKAAEQATAMCAHEEAVAHYERSLRTLEQWAAHDARRRCELLLAMGEAQMCSGATYAVRSKTFHRAAALARELGESSLLGRAAIGLSARTNVLEAANDAHIALLREALEAVGPRDSDMRARLLGFLAQASYLPDPRLHSVALSEEALAIARRVGNPRTLWPVLCSRYVALDGPGAAEERMALATEILQVGEQLGDKEAVLWGRLLRLYEALALGRIAVLEAELAVFTRLAEDLRQPLFRSRAVAVSAALALLEGRFADAEQLAIEASGLMKRADYFPYMAQLYVIRWQQDRLGEIEGFLQALAEQGARQPETLTLLAHIHAEAGRVDEASAVLERLGADDFGTLPRTGLWLLSMAQLTDVCVTLGDAAHAVTLYKLLLPHAKDMVVTINPIFLGSTSFLLGQLAGVMGRHDDALHHLDEALVAHTRIDSPPWIANTDCATARVLLARNAPGDRERAGALLADVLRTTEQLGMRRLQRKALALQEQIQCSVAARLENIESRPAPEPPCSPP